MFTNTSVFMRVQLSSQLILFSRVCMYVPKCVGVYMQITQIYKQVGSRAQKKGLGKMYGGPGLPK